MNIKEAKIEIENAMRAYFTKDEYGRFRLPIHQQRPVFMMGPPGIGKTAVMEQIASELGVGLVSYSMTHHTRQSALGLPFIVKKSYGGTEYDVSEYTMSEIIASVYDMIEETGMKEGILFLDEINCVSETLAPAMLQFLQYKIFGRHRVPDGWLVVTAGNPPEYNNSVREFDIVTWDRLKRIDVEPDFKVWKEYAYNKGVHPAILTFLEIKPDHFYKVESTVDGKTFVTARGWSDLSDMIRLYEDNGIPVTEKLVGQYLQNKKIAKDFAIYYDLFLKYRSDYQVDAILAGKADGDIKERAKNGRFDEKLALLGLILDAVLGHLRAVCNTEEMLTLLVGAMKKIRMELMRPGSDVIALLEKEISEKAAARIRGRKASSMSADQEKANIECRVALIEMREKMKKEPAEGNAAFLKLKALYDEETAALKKMAADAGKKLSNCFVFCEEVFAEGQEILIFVTELTVSTYGARFISRWGCKEYFNHNKELLFHERQKELIAKIENLELEDE